MTPAHIFYTKKKRLSKKYENMSFWIPACER